MLERLISNPITKIWKLCSLHDVVHLLGQPQNFLSMHHAELNISNFSGSEILKRLVIEKGSFNSLKRARSSTVGCKCNSK
jgi:hypothetical protein